MMRIALVAPLYESVPPRLYGGTERVVYYLAETLKRFGHRVTVYASGDSRTSAELIPCCPKALRLDSEIRDSLSPHFLQIEKLVEDQKKYDVIHFHTDAFYFPVARRLSTPSIGTLHGRLDLAEKLSLFDEFPEVNLISISDAQRKPAKHLNWRGTVLHGMPTNELQFHPRAKRGKESYLVFLGRLSPEKGPDRAIEIAKRAGMKIKVAAKFDPEFPEYSEKLKRLMKQPHVEYLGEVGGNDKLELLGGATALLFPIDWPEPFGLVMMEALAVGTPVIAFPYGSVPEVIRDRRNGRIVNDVPEAVQAVKHIHEISRKACRLDFERRFSVEAMTEGYIQIYEEIIAESQALTRRLKSYAEDHLWLDQNR